MILTHALLTLSPYVLLSCKSSFSLDYLIWNANLFYMTFLVAIITFNILHRADWCFVKSTTAITNRSRFFYRSGRYFLRIRMDWLGTSFHPVYRFCVLKSFTSCSAVSSAIRILTVLSYVKLSSDSKRFCHLSSAIPLTSLSYSI